MTNSPSSTQTSLAYEDAQVRLRLIEVKPGVKFPLQWLKQALPNVETALFFGKFYDLDYVQLSDLLSTVLDTPIADALFKGSHSEELQSYLVSVVPTSIDDGDVSFNKVPPSGEILPEVWKQLEVEVASSIKDVAAKLTDTVGLLPGKKGQMLFASMAKLNARRPTIGDYRAHIKHERQRENLLILDVSGSMSEPTVRTLIEDVIALAYMANAHLAIVSDTCAHWDPGAYNVDVVLARAEYHGTHYETLAPLLNRNWGTVITIADYDSSPSAKEALGNECTGHIEQLLDISLVNRPSFLAECVGMFADNVRPLLVGNSRYVLGSRHHEMYGAVD